MEILFLGIAFLMQGRANMEVEVTGVSGENITITCSHNSDLDNVKYFCRGACKDEDVVIKSRERKWYSNGKYSIVDARNMFNVTIFHLTKEDSGTYWCGWEKLAWDTYKKVVLTVREGTTQEPEEDKPTTEEPKKDMPTTKSPKKVHPMNPLYIGASLGVIILALTLVLLIYFTQQKGKISTYSGKEKDETLNCATVSPQKVKSFGALPSSAAQSQHTISYGDSLIPPDSLHYSTVSHNNHMDSNHVSNQSTNVTYSTIILTDESAIYCNV